MKKSLIAGAGVAALGFAAMPILGVFAETSSVTDVVEITIPSSCTLLSNTTNTATGATSTTNTYTANMANGELKSDIGATGVGSNVLSVSCNDTDPTKNTWQLTAIGAGEGATVDVLKPAASGTPIATGTATSGNTSNWAVKVEGASGLAVKNNFNQFRTVPTTATEIATSSESITNAFTMLYQVYVSPTQESDTYTGKVTYTLTNPAP